MEIRNNAPSFGMALRKPEDIGRFSKYVVSSSPSEWLAKRGLAKTLKKQSGNAHFDLEYRPGKGVAVIPTSEKAASKYEEEVFTKASEVSDLRTRMSQRYYSDEYSKAYSKASGPKKAWMTTKKIFATLRVFANMLTHSEEALPSSMRAASEAATKRSAIIEKGIANEAKSLAKKQKLESDIRGIFE